MDNPNLGELGEQPAAVTPATDAGEQPQGSEPASTLDGFQDSQLYEALERLESGGAVPTSPEAPAAPVAAAAPVQAPSGETPAAPAADAAEAPPAAGDDGPQGNKQISRVSVRRLPPTDQTRIAEAIAMVSRKESPDFDTAYASLRGLPAVESQAAPASDQSAAEAAPSPKAQPAQTPAVAEIQATIATLREERKAARRDFDNDRIDELTDQIEDAQADLLRAEQAAAIQAVESRSYDDLYVAAALQVDEKYREASEDEDSAFNRNLDNMITAARARNDPALDDPNYIIAFADQVAADLGLNKGTPVPPPPAKPARTVGDFAPGHHTSGRLSGEAASRLISQLPIEKLQELAFTE